MFVSVPLELLNALNIAFSSSSDEEEDIEKGDDKIDENLKMPLKVDIKSIDDNKAEVRYIL